MLGFGLWHLQGLGSGRSRSVVGIFSLLIIAVSLACSLQPDLLPTPEPAPTEAPADASSSQEPNDASPTLADSPAIASTIATLPPIAALTTLPSIADLVDKVNPTVASISVESVTRGLFFDFNDEGAGSGIVIRPDGYIVTNFHVIQNASQIEVNLPNGKTYTAVVIGRDVITDLAIIKIDTDEDLPVANLVNSDSLKVGDWVVALGNALALKGGPTVTLGIVSARGRTITTDRGTLYDMIQTDAAINDGNSGGPVVNLNGEVIGISTAIFRQAQGIGFAVSSSVAMPIIDSLIEHGRVVRPLIGLTGADVTPARANRLNLRVDEGIIVTRMSRDGPAFKAGIRVGDIIIKMDGIPTPDMARFLTLLWTYQVDDEMQVEYISNGEFKVASVMLTERPPNP
ncbi:MAG: trypsin-like peptidase domain-containing protein [Chloroflexi bacterium]|nr:trypsin-like peptidase domain-containing protein [Chloroflexota bacterium]